jgi:hypothetical protein
VCDRSQVRGAGGVGQGEAESLGVVVARDAGTIFLNSMGLDGKGEGGGSDGVCRCGNKV